MSAREDCRQDLMDDGRLSDDDFGEFILHESAMLSEFLQNITEVSGLMSAVGRTGGLLRRCVQFK